eukprot:s642_g12.t1
MGLCSPWAWQGLTNGALEEVVGLPPSVAPPLAGSFAEYRRCTVGIFQKEKNTPKGHLAPDISFDSWLKEILSETPDRSFISERDEFHVEPAFTSPPQEKEVVFLVERPDESIRLVEDALCREPYRRCGPLPPFPGGAKGALFRQSEVSWSIELQELVASRYDEDEAHLS